LKHGGIALATSIASAVNVGMLWVILKRRIGNILDAEFYRSFGKTVFASLVMGGVILVVEMITPWQPLGPFDARLIYLVLCITGGTAAFFTAAFLLKSPEIESMLKSVQRRIAPVNHP
jgi:putative peptidoglycan lipid II flippase